MTDPLQTPRDAVEILGPWLRNKGDELMLRAVVQRLERRFTVATSTDLETDLVPGLRPLPRVRWLPTVDEMTGAAGRRSLREIRSVVKRGVGLTLLPHRFLRSRQVVDGRDLRALFDCSGFAYGDQWSPGRLVARTRYYETLRRRGVTLVMLPQALGPFRDPELRPLARRLLEQFDVIFPREALSEAHVLDLGIDPDRVFVRPDVSHLLKARFPNRPADWARRVAVVPNARMLDRTKPEVAKRYLDYLVIAVDRIRAADLEPCILLHETNDDVLLRDLLARLDFAPPVFDENAVVTKGYLGCCYANVGSRYHSLVSSLSQVTPSLGTSWAHKYEALFDEYACADWIISPTLPDESLAARIDAFLGPEVHAEIRGRIRHRATAQRDLVESMWARIEEMIPAPEVIPEDTPGPMTVPLRPELG